MNGTRVRIALAAAAVVDVNRAVAVGFAEGPQAALEVLAPLLDDAALASCQPLHAARAELLRRSGDLAAAADAYRAAIALSTNEVERAELHRRVAAL